MESSQKSQDRSALQAQESLIRSVPLPRPRSPPAKVKVQKDSVASPTLDLPGLVRRLDSKRACPVLTDETVLVEGQAFPCHKSVLGFSSQFFRDRLKLQKGLTEIVAPPGVSRDTFALVLDCLYFRDIQINTDNVRPLITAASALGVPRVWRKCQAYLKDRLARDFTGEDIRSIMQQTDHVVKAGPMCWDALVSKAGTLCSTGFACLDPAQLEQVLLSDCLHAQCEVEVVQAFISWVKGQAAPSWKQIRPLLHHLRLPLAHLSSEEVRRLREIAGPLQWVVDQGLAARTAPHLYQWLSCKSLTPRSDYNLEVYIFVVASPVYLDPATRTHRPTGWQVAAFNLGTASWFLPRVAELSTNKLLLDFQDIDDYYPTACAYGNGFYVAFGDGGKNVIYVDALNCRGKRLQTLPVQESDLPGYYLVSPDSSSGVSLRVSGKVLVASHESDCFLCNVHAKRWIKAEEEDMKRIPVSPSDEHAEDIRARYSYRYCIIERSVRVVQVDSHTYVVDGEGMIRKVQGLEFVDVASISGFRGRESFGVVQEAGTIYVVGGVSQANDDSPRFDVIRVNVKQRPVLVERLTSSMPCPLVHAAFRVLVRKSTFRGRRVS